MFDKLLDEIKKKLPGAKKEEEDSEGLDDENSNSDSDDVDENEADADADPKENAPKKKNSPLIKIIIILAIGYLAFDYLMPKEDDVNIDQMIQKPISKKKKNNKKREEEATKEAPLEITNQEPPKEVAPVEVVKNDLASTTVNENVADNSQSNLSKNSDEELSKAIDTIPEETKPVNSNGELVNAPVEEINILKNTEAGSNLNLGEDNQPNKKTEQLTENSLESKITEEAEYVEPPNYEVIGRGLVYNCKGKHWACIDKASYQACFKNMKYNSSNGKKSECVTQNVYANEDDCSTVQRYNVSTNVSTAFCK